MYSFFEQCNQQLADITPLDYFLAKECTDLYSHQLQKEELSQLFHLIIALNQALSQGHTCLELDSIAEQTLWRETIESNEKPGFTFKAADDLKQMLLQLPIAAEQQQPLVFDLEALYLRRYYYFEEELADYLKARLSQRYSINQEHASQILSTLFTANAFETPDRQKLAVANALNKNTVVIAGGPGTGKTTTVAKLLIALQILNDCQLTITMAAPTGKAAQRLKESLDNSKAIIAKQATIDIKVLDSLPETASTLHRLLGVISNSHNFKHNEENPLHTDVLLVDEISMVDLPMMTRLMRALSPSTRLILLGDAQQLPSVAAGSILADIAPENATTYTPENNQYLCAVTGQHLENDNNGYDHLSKLVFSHRFKGGGGIGQLAKAVITGDASLAWHNCTNSPSEVTLVENVRLDSWLETLVTRYLSGLITATSLTDAFKALENFRLLAPMRQGDFGVEKLNEKIEAIIHGHKQFQSNNGLYQGRPIMITANNYQMDLYNGDIGIIWPNEQGKLQAAFPITSQQSEPNDEHFRFLSLNRLPHYESVYAMTIHKTQGSEFNHVAIALPNEEVALLSRELLYTAITRAKQSVEINCTEQVFKNGVSKKVERFSKLTKRLNF